MAKYIISWWLTLFHQLQNQRPTITHFKANESHSIPIKKKFNRIQYYAQILPPYSCRERERKRNELLRNIQWSIDSGPTSGHHDLLHVSIPYHHIYGNERLDFLEHLIVPHTHTQIRLTHAISSHLIHVIWLIWILQHRFYLSLSFFVQGFISLCFFLLLSKLFWAIKSLMCFCESQK